MIETVNCALIVRKDQEATNGIVHMVDSFLDPSVTVQRDLVGLVLQDGRFSELAKAMEQFGFVNPLLENHVIPHPICLPAIIGEHKVRTLGDERLKFDCDRKGTTVEEKRLSSDFMLAENGVLYMLDDLLLPDRGK
ncbi:Transforming growth factor-beta-induced protein ig-h3 [Blattella germanica]|nr:Transforming growth factor-beta-induced protein ig-h3 [Blattella germanica]